MKTLHCRDAGFNCDAVVREDSEEKVMEQAARHAHYVHGVRLSEENNREIRRRIKDG